MLPSQQLFAPISMPTPETPKAVLAVARPAKDGTMGAVGVAAKVTTLTGVSLHWMSGFAASDDMARTALVQHLLSIYQKTSPQLEVWSANIDAFEHVPKARLNGGMRSGKNKKQPFAAFDLFDPVEAALRRGEWFLQTFGKGEEPSAYYATAQLANRALLVARERAIEFFTYRNAHPDWYMLEVGNTDNPLAERHE